MAAAPQLHDEPTDDLIERLASLVEERSGIAPYRDMYQEDISVESFEDFRALPTFRKEDVLDQDEPMTLLFKDRIDQSQHTLYTSGTSGTAAITLFSKADRRAEMKKYDAMRGRYPAPDERTLVVHAIKIQKLGIWPLLESDDRFYAFADHRDLQLAAALLDHTGARCVWTSPTIALKLADTLEPNQRRDVSRLIMTGEPLSRERREKLGELFPNATQYMQYGSMETGTLGYQCRELAGQNTYHIFPDHLLYEVLEPGTNEPASEGELVVTNLTSDSSLPFTRYRTGDRVRIERDACSCATPAITVLGRIQFDRLKLAGITVYREHFEDALATVSDLVEQEYQIHLYDEGAGDDVESRFEVRLIPRTGADRSEHVRNEVERELMENFTVTDQHSWADAVEKGWLLPIEVTFVDSIGDGAKRTPVVDHRTDG